MFQAVVFRLKTTMKITIFLFALFHSVFISSQDPVPEKYKIHSATLCAGDVLSFGERSLKFKKIVSDSRCPKNVTCIWAGEVKVLVEFYEEGKFKGNRIISGSNIAIGEIEIVPTSDISMHEFFETEGLKIQKIAVTPYPVASNKINPEEYTVEISLVERLDID